MDIFNNILVISIHWNDRNTFIEFLKYLDKKYFSFNHILSDRTRDIFYFQQEYFVKNQFISSSSTKCFWAKYFLVIIDYRYLIFRFYIIFSPTRINIKYFRTL